MNKDEDAGIKILIDRLETENAQLREENAALNAQFKGVGIVPYLDRMRELASERDQLRRELEEAKKEYVQVLQKVADSEMELAEARRKVEDAEVIRKAAFGTIAAQRQSIKELAEPKENEPGEYTPITNEELSEMIRKEAVRLGLEPPDEEK